MRVRSVEGASGYLHRDLFKYLNHRLLVGNIESMPVLGLRVGMVRMTRTASRKQDNCQLRKDGSSATL